MSEPTAYRRLPGTAAAPLKRRTLYLGPDHVLSVRSLGYVQEYRRFYLREIQAIVLAESGNSWAYYFHASAVFLLVISLALVYSSHLISAGLSGIGAALAFVLGMRTPNCACYLKTATTTERLPSLGRLSAARKTLAILEPLITQAQSDLPP